MQEINFISFAPIPPSPQADFVVIQLTTDFGTVPLILSIKDYHQLTTTDFFLNKYVSFKDGK